MERVVRDKLNFICTRDFGLVSEQRLRNALKEGWVVMVDKEPIMDYEAYCTYGGDLYKYIAGLIDKLEVPKPKPKKEKEVDIDDAL